MSSLFKNMLSTTLYILQIFMVRHLPYAGKIWNMIMMWSTQQKKILHTKLLFSHSQGVEKGQKIVGYDRMGWIWYLVRPDNWILINMWPELQKYVAWITEYLIQIQVLYRYLYEFYTEFLTIVIFECLCWNIF